MTIPGSANPLLLASAAAEPTAYEIERSLRFNSADSAYLSRTPASAGNRKTFTWSLWCKRGILSSSGTYSLFGANSGSASGTYLAFHNDTLRFRDAQGGTTFRETSAVYRDPSSWYHVVLSIDTTQATANDRIKLYVNRTEVTTFSTTNNPTQNADLAFNSTNGHMVGGLWDTNYANNLFAPFDGYLADVFLIDGQALDPTSFGEFDDNGIWQPKAYTGSYGTNGFHLPFSDNSTAAALGTDTLSTTYPSPLVQATTAS